MKVESIGKIIFSDESNGLYAKISMGKVKNMPSDYLKGDIMYNGKIMSSIGVTYLGYIDFDKTRYWDYRRVTPLKINIQKGILPSDHLFRLDL